MSGSATKAHLRISKRLGLCKSCNRVWERQYQTSKVLYYENFPTYKLKRNKCKQCKNMKNNDKKLKDPNHPNPFNRKSKRF